MHFAVAAQILGSFATIAIYRYNDAPVPDTPFYVLSFNILLYSAYRFYRTRGS
jgi:hypothetical protein